MEEGKQDDVDSNKKKENDKLAHGKHYYVFVVQSITRNGPPIRFIAARYCVANLSHRWLRAKLEYIEPTLAFYGFTVCSESFDGASENRSCMAHRTTLTFEDLCGIQLKKIVSDELENVNDIANNDNKIDGDSSNSSSSSSSSISINSDMDESTESISNNSEDENKKCHYTEHQLPWTMPIAFYHPSIEGIIIVAAGDMPHGLKKMRNAMHLSGKEDKVRDLHNYHWPHFHSPVNQNEYAGDPTVCSYFQKRAIHIPYIMPSIVCTSLCQRMIHPPLLPLRHPQHFPMTHRPEQAPPSSNLPCVFVYV